jgi:ABC-type Fe3+-hydroxamate transport system substrate-binding protein
MSFLNTIINSVGDGSVKERLQERIELVAHKIKFMDKIQVACLDTENWQSNSLNEIIEAAGGIIQEDASLAQVVIYQEPNVGIVELMGSVPALLDHNWPSVTYNRVYLVENDEIASGDPAALVAALEDVVEMLYPGYFVFGNEGTTWTSFGI